MEQRQPGEDEETAGIGEFDDHRQECPATCDAVPTCGQEAFSRDFHTMIAAADHFFAGRK